MPQHYLSSPNRRAARFNLCQSQQYSQGYNQLMKLGMEVPVRGLVCNITSYHSQTLTSITAVLSWLTLGLIGQQILHQ